MSNFNRANEASETSRALKLKREKILLKKIENTLLLLIMQTNFLLHYLYRLVL